MVRNMGVARDLGYLRVPAGLMVDMKDVEQLPDNRVVLVSTGSQGEPLSALSRMANRSHHQIRIEADDTVVLASSLIPGNENAVYRVINGLSRWGARVVHKGVARVHVSGHASAGELLYLLNATKPSQPHAGARRVAPPARPRRAGAGSPASRASGSCSPRTASSSTSSTARPSIVGAVPCGYVFVDGVEVGDVGESTLKDRRILGDEGFISITVAVDSRHRQDRRRAGDRARGFSDDRARLRPGARAHRGRARPQPPARASPTRTSSRRTSAASSAAG